MPAVLVLVCDLILVEAWILDQPEPRSRSGFERDSRHRKQLRYLDVRVAIGAPATVSVFTAVCTVFFTL
jgi:hypothetical protein